MKDFEKKVHQYLEDRGWHQLRPANLAKSIMIEGAELLELFQWDNQTAEEVRNDPEKLAKIKKELADVMIYCFDMGVVLDLDMEEILDAKLKHITEKYPTSIFNKDSNPQDPGTQEAYWKIKNDYRKKS
jgi:NTP pyrophosphatase (non-canonical NTP hydrolase)